MRCGPQGANPGSSTQRARPGTEHMFQVSFFTRSHQCKHLKVRLNVRLRVNTIVRMTDHQNQQLANIVTSTHAFEFHKSVCLRAFEEPIRAFVVRRRARDCAFHCAGSARAIRRLVGESNSPEETMLDSAGPTHWESGAQFSILDRAPGLSGSASGRVSWTRWNSISQQTQWSKIYGLIRTPTGFSRRVVVPHSPGASPRSVQDKSLGRE